MTKKRSIWKFVLLSIVAVIGIVLSVCPIPVPFTNYTYNGFANSISLGLDLAGGLSVVYECDATENTQDLNSAISATEARLKEILYNEGYSESTVARQGSNRIRIEVPSAKDTDEIFSFLENPKTLYMTLEKANGTNSPEVFITGYDVANVYATYQNNENNELQHGVVIQFTDEGKTKFANLTQMAANNTAPASENLIHIYLGEVKGDPWGSLTCKSQITDGSTFISGEGLNDKESAKRYALNIMSGAFSVKLTLIENSVISATLGRDALLYGIIAGAVAIVLVMAIMWWRYGDFGLLANFALVFYMILMLFFLQAIPFVQLTLPGIAGIILSLGMAVDGNIIIFERIKEEYASGKKMHLAVKSGFKRAFWPIFDSNITTVFTSIILYILGTSAIKGFAITLLLGILLSMFTSLVITRFLVKSYLPLNSTKPHKARLYRDENVVEIKEEDSNVASNDVSEKPAEIVVEGGENND